MIKNNESIPSRQAPSLVMFGGTFDPPHTGHAACLNALVQQFPTSKIFVIPAADPPPTNKSKKSPWLSFGQRLELCRAMVADCGLTDEVEVSCIEGSLPKPNYTVNTLKALLAHASENPSGSLVAILLGADQFASFDTWRDPELIIRMADLILVARPGKAFEWPPGKIARQARLWTLDVRTPPASSTEIRKAIREGTPVPAGWLQPGVISRMQQLTGKTIKVSPGETDEPLKRGKK